MSEILVKADKEAIHVGCNNNTVRNALSEVNDGPRRKLKRGVRTTGQETQTVIFELEAIAR